ncbi:hypothetical protein PISL3812_04645 [Talaromyces islandicus]|uniref:Uncharacterized protein n=1 Tax=Talaromyces islandicus TaxID=28573 RepID=A0A0U1LXR5_TALIS|nr:hypothetical protein PISL3812_04645 [Talaromyces islandicus]
MPFVLTNMHRTKKTASAQLVDELAFGLRTHAPYDEDEQTWYCDQCKDDAVRAMWKPTRDHQNRGQILRTDDANSISLLGLLSLAALYSVHEG